ncbi:hypothetical protein G4B88_003405, partial [Cannabis sativa]
KKIMIRNWRIQKEDFGGVYLSLGYSTPFLSLGESYMYSSLAAAKAAVISVGEEIASQLGLPAGICPLVLYLLAQEMIFKLLPHSFVDPNKLPELFKMVNFRGKDVSQPTRASNRVFQVYRCVVTCQDMVQNKDSTKSFDKVHSTLSNLVSGLSSSSKLLYIIVCQADYYAHLERYNPIFHERIALYVSVIGTPLISTFNPD